MKTVIINSVGFDGGGISRLGIEYSKLDFDVYFKDNVLPLQFRTAKIANVQFYTTEEELLKIISKYDRVIFLTFYDNNLDHSVLFLEKLRKNLPNVEVCYLYCDRRVDRLILLLDVLKKYDVAFDHYFSINPNILNFVDNCTALNVNAFTFSPLKCNNTRKNIVLTAGRVEAVKGTLMYFHSINDEFLNTNYYYVHEGARFKFNSSGTVSTPPQLLTLFDTTQSPKQPKSKFAFKLYGELPERKKLTIYPSYSIDEISRWSNYYAGICCILGSRSRCTNIKNFMGSNWIAEDKRENKLLLTKSKIWNDAVEYANLEMIDVGLPVLFSRKYAEILDFHEEALIYNSFSNIPDKLDALKSNYDEVRKKQYDIFREKQVIVNENIKKVFTDESIIFSN